MSSLPRCLALCLAVAGCSAAGVAPATCAEASCAADAGQDPVTLMQLKSQVQRGGISHGKAATEPEPVPVGRTLISANPEVSAKFFLDYFDSREVQVPACSHQTMKAVEVQAGLGQTFTYYFVQDSELSRGSLNSTDIISEVRDKMNAVLMGKEGLYNAWIDNHDGFNQSSFKYKKALADGVKIGIFDWTATNEVFGIVRFWIPETLFTFELVAPKAELDEYNIPEFISADCRDDITGMPPPVDVFGADVRWFKTTMMSAKPWVAGVWASDILGVVDYPAPFPWPPAEGCTEAIWKIYPGSSYMLHFVLSSEFQSTSALDSTTGLVQKFVDEVYTFRKLEDGVFDHFMLNNLILQVDSLDPYVQKLRAKGYPFMLTRVGDQYALFMDVPQNAQIVQLRSKHVSEAEPNALEGVCLA